MALKLHRARIGSLIAAIASLDAEVERLRSPKNYADRFDLIDAQARLREAEATFHREVSYLSVTVGAKKTRAMLRTFET